MADPVDLKAIVAEAITEWNAEAADEDRGWRHGGYSDREHENPRGLRQAHCAAWAEGLNCCTDPDHGEFDTLVGAIAAKLEPFAKALDDIADLDTNIHSPNSVNWRATLIYATQRAAQTLESLRKAQEPSGD